MSDARVPSPAIFVVDPPESRVAAVARYGAAMLVVVTTVAALAAAIGRGPTNDVASETEDAVLVDLPPVEAAAPAPGSDTATRAAADAAPPLPQDRPPDPAPPDPAPPLPEPPQDPSPPPPPIAPAPAVALPEPTATPPPLPDPATATMPQDAEAPSGAEDNGEARESDVAKAATAQLITLWQRALMSRLETAKRALAHTPHAFGTVKVAFQIDSDGRLVSEHVASGSGSPTLDAAALTLVAHAAPFPTPPAGTQGRALSFVVPVRFLR